MEVNLLKQSSVVQMDIAFKREASLSRAEAIDEYMDLSQCERADGKLDKHLKRELAALNKSDPDYKKKVAEIEQRIKQTKFKAMKKLNLDNEKVPAKVKANMLQRKTSV